MNRDARASLGLGLVTSLLVLAITITSDVLLLHTRPVSFWPYLGDDFVMSGFAGGVVWFYERHRLRELAKKLYVIAEMNHRVRNELEIIQYSAYATKEKEHMSVIRESVAKVEAALAEILEGRKPGQKRPLTRGAKPLP